jgi:hypothetical protein
MGKEIEPPSRIETPGSPRNAWKNIKTEVF